MARQEFMDGSPENEGTTPRSRPLDINEVEKTHRPPPDVTVSEATSHLRSLAEGSEGVSREERIARLKAQANNANNELRKLGYFSRSAPTRTMGFYELPVVEGDPEATKLAQHEWLRRELALLERTKSVFPETNQHYMLQAIDQAHPDIKENLIKELNARVAAHNGALVLRRTNLEGFVNYMQGQPIELFDIISKVERVEEARALFDANLIKIFSSPRLFRAEKAKDDEGNVLKDLEGNDVEITRKDKIKIGSYDLPYYQNWAKKEIVINHIKKNSSRFTGLQLENIINTWFEDSDEVINNIESKLENQSLSKAQKEELIMVVKEADTAVRLVERMCRISFVASSCEVPEIYKRDVPELNIKKGSVMLYKKKFRKRAITKEDGQIDYVVEQVLIEKTKKIIKGQKKEVEVFGSVITPENEEDIIINFLRDNIQKTGKDKKELVIDRTRVKKGNGDFAAWRNIWMYPYAEWLRRGYEELRPYVKTGMLDFVMYQDYPSHPSKPEEAQSSAMERFLRGVETRLRYGQTSDTLKLSEDKNEEGVVYGLESLLENVRKQEWDDGDWGTWLGSLGEADKNRSALEARDGYLWKPSVANVLKLAEAGFTNFKDKVLERQLIVMDLFRGAIKFNTSKKTVEKYYGKGAPVWTQTEKNDELQSTVRRGFITPEQAVEIRNDPDLQPTWFRILAEIWGEYILPIGGGAIEDFSKIFAKQFFSTITPSR